MGQLGGKDATSCLLAIRDEDLEPGTRLALLGFELLASCTEQTQEVTESGVGHIEQVLGMQLLANSAF